MSFCLHTFKMNLFNKTELIQKVILDCKAAVCSSESLLNLLNKKVVDELEGKCCSKGYVQIGSVEICDYSAGMIVFGNQVVYSVICNCNVFCPIAGQQLTCKVTEILGSGVVCKWTDNPSPFVVFLHQSDGPNLEHGIASLKEEQIITVLVCYTRFQLHDKEIEIIAHLEAMPSTVNK